MSISQDNLDLDELDLWGFLTKDHDMGSRKRIGVQKSGAGTISLENWQVEQCQLQTVWAIKLVIEDSGLQKVIVHSQYLMRLLKKLGPSPGVDALPLSTKIERPFEIFFGGWETLAKLHESIKSDDVADFKALKYIYDKYIHGFHNEIRQRISQNTIIYTDLWALYRRGTIICGADSFSEQQLFYTLSCKNDKSRYSRGPAVVVRCWHTTWNQSAQRFTRTSRRFHIIHFEGTRTITSLETYPLNTYIRWANNPIPDIENLLEARGRKWREYILSGYPCLQYNGPIKWVDPGDKGSSWRDFKSSSSIFFSPIMRPNPVATHNGKVILDQTSTSSVLKYNSPLFDLYNLEDESENISLNDLDAQGEHRSLDSVSPDQEFSRLQALLCPSFLAAFVLDEKSWCVLLVKHLSTPNWSTVAFEHLVMEERIKNRLKGLVTQHKGMKKAITGDVIEKKGKGMIIVLHGAPGVGKTLTAEAVAEYTKKPLVQMDIDNPVDQGFSRFLELQLKLAARWDGVLLLDEADVILETRSWENLQRNSLVSTFLHAIEYYEGILILTSNRLKAMDIAFQSRINIAVYFKQLNPTSRREIWLRFIERLPDTEQRAKEELMEKLEDMAEWPLNGRQIRNLMTLAQSVAFIDHRMKGALRYSHVEDAANATLEFQDWFSEGSKENKLQLVEIPRNRRLREL